MNDERWHIVATLSMCHSNKSNWDFCDWCVCVSGTGKWMRLMRLSCVKILNPVRNNVPLMISLLCVCLLVRACVSMFKRMCYLISFEFFAFGSNPSPKWLTERAYPKRHKRHTVWQRISFQFTYYYLSSSSCRSMSRSVCPRSVSFRHTFFLLAAQQWMQELMRKKKMRNRNENRSASLERSCLLSYRNKEI